MPDPGTVLAIISLAGEVIKITSYWIDAFREAPADMRSILLETSIHRAILSNVELLTKHDDKLGATINALFEPDGTIDHCHRILRDLVSLFPGGLEFINGNIGGKEDKKETVKEKIKAFKSRSGWAVGKEKARKLLEELGRYKELINLALTAESTQDIKYIKQHTTQLVDGLLDSQINRFCEWVEKTNPSRIHNDTQKKISAETCDWILRNPEWIGWLSGEYRFLWIYGIPGAGKSVLASYLNEELKKYRSSGLAIATAYYYCFYGHSQDESEPLLRWLLSKLCRKMRVIPNAIYESFKEGCDPSTSDLLMAISAGLETASVMTLYLVVDAVDESQPRNQLLDVLRVLATEQRFNKIQLLCTSRQYHDIESVLEPISTPLSMDNDSVLGAIQCHVHAELYYGEDFKGWSDELLEETETALAFGARGMFRWAVCQLDRLHRLAPKPHIIKNALATLPETIEATYDRILSDVPRDQRPLVRHCLRWIYFHNEVYDGNPVPCNLILQAFAESEQADTLNFDEKVLRKACGCLVQFSRGIGFDQYQLVGVVEDSGQPVVTAMFAHYTVREFLDPYAESDRIRLEDSPAAYFKLGPEILLTNTREILVAAHRFGSDGGPDEEDIYDGLQLLPNDPNICKGYSILPNNDITDTTNTNLQLLFEAVPAGPWRPVCKLQSHLPSYCVATSLVVLNDDNDPECVDVHSNGRKPHYGDGELARHPDLSELLFSLFDPSDGRLEAMAKHMGYLPNLVRNNYFRLGEFAFRGLSHAWTTRTTAETRNVRLLFILLTVPRYLEHAKRFIQKMGDKLGSVHVPLDGSNDGSPMVELFAWETDKRAAVHLLLDHEPSVPDPTKLLYAHLRDYEECADEEEELLHRILSLGADPNGAGYTDTPLQIAGAKALHRPTKALLLAGADPNGTGTRGGISASKGTDKNKKVHGHSPLAIALDEINDYEWYEANDPDGGRGKAPQEYYMNASFLISHGARYYRPPEFCAERIYDDWVEPIQNPRAEAAEAEWNANRHLFSDDLEEAERQYRNYVLSTEPRDDADSAGQQVSKTIPILGSLGSLLTNALSYLIFPRARS